MDKPEVCNKKCNSSFINKKNDGQIIFLIVWIVISLLSVIFHEPWRDELQAWLVARDLSLPEVFSWMKYEGHFILWYLVIKPLCTLNLSPDSLNYLTWFFTLIAVVLILFKSPFSRVTKIAIIFSAPIIFWFPVVSRCYALLLPLLFGIACIYPSRKSRPVLYGILIALLANVHVIYEGIVLVLFLMLFLDVKDYKNKRELRPAVISGGLILLGVVFAFSTVFLCMFKSDSYTSQAVTATFLWDHLLSFASQSMLMNHLGRWLMDNAVISALCMIVMFLAAVYFEKKNKFVFYYSLIAMFLNIYFFFIDKANYIPPVTLVVVISLFFLFKKEKLLKLAFIISVGWYFFSIVAFCCFLPHRALSFPIFIIFFAWIFYQNMDCSKQVFNHISRCLILFTVFTSAGTLIVMLYDVKMPYSGIKDCGMFIKENVPEKMSLGTYPFEDKATCLSAYTGRKIHEYTYGRDLTYFPRDIGQSKPMVFADLIKSKRINSDVMIFPLYFFRPGTKRIFLGNDWYVSFYKSGNVMFDESFAIYIRENLLHSVAPVKKSNSPRENLER